MILLSIITDILVESSDGDYFHQAKYLVVNRVDSRDEESDQ